MQDSVNKILPWQKQLWEQTTGNLAGLSHGLLLTGEAGIGKLQFADQLAELLLCESPGDFACGTCPSCHLLKSGNHPDFRRITLEDDEAENSEGGEGAEAPARSSRSKKPSTQIKIDQIRSLEDFVFVGSHRHGRRVAIISPAEAMNIAAANALLKMLEEPPAGVHFILVSSAWRRLLPTLISRCRQLVFGLPDAEQATAWLRAQGAKDAEKILPLTGGAPLAAASWAESDLATSYQKAAETFAQSNTDIVSLAAKWQASLNSKSGVWTAAQLVDALQKWVYDLERVRSGVTARYFVASAPALTKLAAKVQVSRLARLQDELQRIRAVITHPLNPQLMLEDMAARYLAAISPR